MSYYTLKLIGILMLPLFHGAAFLGGFQFPILRYFNPYYSSLYPIILVLASLFFALGIIKKDKGKEQDWSTDTVITFVGGFFILMNFVVSLLVFIT